MSLDVFCLKWKDQPRKKEEKKEASLCQDQRVILCPGNSSCGLLFHNCASIAISLLGVLPWLVHII